MLGGLVVNPLGALVCHVCHEVVFLGDGVGAVDDLECPARIQQFRNEARWGEVRWRLL